MIWIVSAMVALGADPVTPPGKGSSSAVVVEGTKLSFDPKTCTEGHRRVDWGLGSYGVNILGHKDGQCLFEYFYGGELSPVSYHLVKVPLDSGPVTIKRDMVKKGKETFQDTVTSFPLDQAKLVRIEDSSGSQEVRVGDTDEFVKFRIEENRSEMRPRTGDAVKFVCRVYDGPEYKAVRQRAGFTYFTAEFVVGSATGWQWLESAMAGITVGDRRRVQVPMAVADAAKSWPPDGYVEKVMFVEVQLMSAVRGDEAPLRLRLERVAPRAAGVALVEVTDLKEEDRRPNDGPLALVVSLKILTSTGNTRDRVNIIKVSGGHPTPPPPPGTAPKPPPIGALKLDTFKKGERYWVAFSSDIDFVRNPQLVVKAWPDKDAPPVLEEAVKADHYARRPQYDPRNGLTYSSRAEKGKPNWWACMERDGQYLWEVPLPGEKGAGEWRQLHLDQWSSGLGHADRTKTNWYLCVETLTTLEASNPYQLPAGKHKAVYVLDSDTGRTASVRVSDANKSDPSVVHFYDLATGKLRREERFDFLKTGGRAAGADTEDWLRQVVRTYDPASGKMKGEEVLRHASTPDGSRYVPVKAK